MLYLINVPQWTTAMPPVALTCLAGYFDEEKIPWKQVDLNIKFYNYIFSTKFYKIIECCLSKDEMILLNGDVINYNHYLCSNIETAISNLKNKQKILDKDCLLWSNHIIENYLQLINKYLKPIRISLNSMEFGFEDINSYTELIQIALSNKLDKLNSIYKDILNKQFLENESIIGFSINNLSQLISAVVITNILKKTYNCHFFIGGAYVSAHSEELSRCKEIFKIFQSICLYDGEHAIKNLYDHFYYHKPILYNNILFTKQNKLPNKKQFYIEDIRKLPAPSYKGIDFKEYFSPIKIISLPVSRGCYGSCTFCSYNHCASSKWREQEIGQILSNIAECKNKYHSNYFFLSVAALSPNMAIKLSKKLIEKNIHIKWATGIRMEKAFLGDVIDFMAKAGCVRLDIGIESANQFVLNQMNKKVEVKYYQSIIDNMSKSGIYPYLYIIKNFPTESYEQWKDTVDFLEQVKEKILGFSCYEYTLTPNTYVWENPEAYKLQIESYDEDIPDIINKVKNMKDGISLSDKMKKENLLEEFYVKNKNIFKKYGEAFLLKNMPTTFPNQMLYINEKTKNRTDDVFLDKDKCIKLNPNIVQYKNNDGNTLLYILDTSKKISISDTILQIIKDCTDMTVGQYINLLELEQAKEEKLIKLLNNLMKERIISEV